MQTDPKGPVCRRFVIQSTGLVSRRCGGTKPAEAPIEGKQHALDVDIHVITVAEVAPIAAVTGEIAVVVEIVEIGEAILAADRQVVGELPLDAAAEGYAIGADIVIMVEEDVTIVIADTKFRIGIHQPAPTDQAV